MSDPPVQTKTRPAPARVIRAHVRASGGLVTLPDLARRWHLSDTRVRNLAHAPDFPEPFARVSGGKIAVYLAGECDAWRRARNDRFVARRD